MKIAYITTYNNNDIKSWSGCGYFIQQALKQNGYQIKSIGDLNVLNSFLFENKQLFFKKICSKTYRGDRDPSLIRHYAKQIENCLNVIDHDIIFSPGTIPIAQLKTDKPIIFWTDATFAGMLDFYPEYTNLCKKTVIDGNRMEQMALAKSELAIYSSHWAAQTAIENYDVNPEKVKVVPFGANILSFQTEQDIINNLERKKFNTCKLLFIGADWERKGGNIAIAIADELNKWGIKTELHIVGSKPSYSFPDFVVYHGFVSKSTDLGQTLMDKLYTESHFLVLPSRAECCAVVFAEASSFGLPSIATKVGGISTAVHDGKNGQTFLLSDSAEKYCEYIERFMASPQEYKKLAISSYQEYSGRLNWLSSGQKIRGLIEDLYRG